jgi:hypothetical protein
MVVCLLKGDKLSMCELIYSYFEDCMVTCELWSKILTMSSHITAYVTLTDYTRNVLSFCKVSIFSLLIHVLYEIWPKQQTIFCYK